MIGGTEEMLMEVCGGLSVSDRGQKKKRGRDGEEGSHGGRTLAEFRIGLISSCSEEDRPQRLKPLLY